MSRKALELGVGLSLALMLSACAGRAPAPVAVIQPIDDTMTCDSLRAEVSANNDRVTALGSESGAKVAQNVAAVAVGLFFFPALFLMDTQGAAGIDERSLRSRNDYLARIIHQG